MLKSDRDAGKYIRQSKLNWKKNSQAVDNPLKQTKNQNNEKITYFVHYNKEAVFPEDYNQFMPQ